MEIRRVKGNMGVNIVASARDERAATATPITRAALNTNSCTLRSSGVYEYPLPIHFKKLMKLIVYGSPSNNSSLMLTTALMSCANSRFNDEIVTQLTACSAEINRIDLETFQTLFDGYSNINLRDLSFFDGMEAPHYVYALSLILTLIGKSLDNRNFTPWMERRIRSFAQPLGLAIDDPLLSALQPCIEFCQRFYAEVKVFWKIRRLFFMNINSMASRSDLLASGTKITKALLGGAEISNWMLILHWIIILNPDLLMWNELSKFLTMLVAASCKFTEIGELAPWCKLILPVEELTEFKSENLNLPYAVAKAIATHCGNSSNKNIQGTPEEAFFKDVVKYAIYIAKNAGGAKTVDVMALRCWRYNGYQNPRLYEALNTGAENETIDDEREAMILS
ncbi:hypothetical protein J6590_062952 [Homalodisca vitripennis]|nr:hypothetical protein J6590_062952 [Homalodisca vitripennis]